jgi:DNA-binding NarL/FixJ family response regulator
MGLKTKHKAGLRKRRILLVDDHPILRESFGELIDLEPDLHVGAQAADAHGALTELRRGVPDLVVVDIELRETSGVDLIKKLKTLYPHLPVLALSVHDEVLYAERALGAGARGYVMKQASLDEVLRAMRQVLSGERYLSVKMQARMGEVRKETTKHTKQAKEETVGVHLAG